MIDVLQSLHFTQCGDGNALVLLIEIIEFLDGDFLLLAVVIDITGFVDFSESAFAHFLYFVDFDQEYFFKFLLFLLI